jgi:hypothetical protein
VAPPELLEGLRPSSLDVDLRARQHANGQRVHFFAGNGPCALYLERVFADGPKEGLGHLLRAAFAVHTKRTRNAIALPSLLG